MRSTVYFLILIAALIQNNLAYANSTNFGDEVVECVSKIHPPLDSPELSEIFALCENEVAEKRALKVSNINSGSKSDNIITAKDLIAPDLAQSAGAGFFSAADTDPKTYAEMSRLAKIANVPVDTVMQDPKGVKRQVTMDSINFDSLAKTSPATASVIGNIDKAKIAHDDLNNMTDEYAFATEIIFWIGKNILSLGAAIFGYMIRGPIGAVFASLPFSLILGYGASESEYLNNHGIDFTDPIKFNHALNDTVFISSAHEYALANSISYALQNCLIIFLIFKSFSYRKLVFEFVKNEFLKAKNSLQLKEYCFYLIDFVFLMGAPLILVSILEKFSIIGADTKNALMAAVISSVIAYSGAFVFQGQYGKTPFRIRMSVFQSVLFLSIIYWLGMAFLNISDGEGNGNVMTMLFGLAIVGALAWNKVKDLPRI